MECSALLDVGVGEIFTEAARMVLIDRGIIRGDIKKSINKPPHEEPMK